MIHRTAVVVVLAALACVTAPSAARLPTIAPGVTISGTHVGGLTAEPARTKVAAAFDRPLTVVDGTQRWTIAPQRFGAGAAAQKAVSQALVSAPGARLDVKVTWSDRKLARYVDRIAKGIDRAPLDARFVEVTDSGPVISPEREGIAVMRDVLRHTIEGKLAQDVRTRVTVPTRALHPTRTRDNYGPVIWIDRGSNTLRLYNGESLVRTFGVATGQSAYPTPPGLWHIVDMQRDPWWIPPDSAWAKNAKPTPPGPGNPLGTRWMGLDAAGVGIHGTPDAASIGYSASHGCIRMRIPDAEWLFDNVEVGTPVQIT
jgi:lipoprotein-anchoring transpeptidase ErfK/SrfK